MSRPVVSCLFLALMGGLAVGSVCDWSAVLVLCPSPDFVWLVNHNM